MKALLAQSQRLSPFAIRRRVRSVQTTIKREVDRMPEEDIIMHRLERGLERELDKEEEPLAEPSFMLPESDTVTIEHKLWKYFVGRMELVRDKVQKERLNVCQRELQTIKEQILKRKAANTDIIAQLAARIHAKNKEIHHLFQEIKLERATQQNIAALLKAKKRRVQQTEDNSPQKMEKIKEKIEGLRTEITKAEAEMQHHQGELFKIEEQWKSFLRHFLREGYYFQNGVTNILKEMAEIGYAPTPEDFPSFLDFTSKQCLIGEYHQLANQVSTSSARKFMKSETVTESKRNMRMLIKKDNLQKIYNGTRDYMMDWLRNEGWKQEINLPRIQSTYTGSSANGKSGNDWRSQQRRRLNLIDDKERYKKVRAVLFGSKVETIS